MTEPCPCGGPMLEDPQARHDAQPYGMDTRRFFCRLCGRDRFVASHERPSPTVLLSVRQHAARRRQRDASGRMV